jgi:urease accessory protein
MFVFGRVARGERFRQGLLHESWRIGRGGALAWVDALRLDGDIAAMLDRRAGFDGAEAFATIAYVGADAEPHLPRARDLAEAAPCRAGATFVNGILLARALGESAAVRAALGQIVSGLRHEAAGLPPSLPRVWRI